MPDETRPNNLCVNCGKEFSSDDIICPEDGGILVAAKKDPAIGTIVAEKYEIQEVLGGGGMGVVYRAKHLLMQRTVAIKMLLPETVSDEYALARFQKEAQAASSLNHPNILTIFDFGISDKKQPYLVMDYLKGSTLAEVLDKEGYLHLQKGISIFIQIASALSHAHQKGVIHRDLKPANIMLVEYEGQGDFVKIVDFGIAKTLHREDGQSIELTQTGQVFGSPIYMSPEQCRGTHLDARADIYSMGCVMYRSITGSTPFLGQDALELMFKHVNEKPAPFDDVCPQLKIPKNFQDVVLKCLEKDPNNRYQSMLDLRKELEGVGGTSINSPFIFPATEVDNTKTPMIGSLDEQRSTLNEIIAQSESQKKMADEIAAAQKKLLKQHTASTSDAASAVARPSATSEISMGSAAAASTIQPPQSAPAGTKPSAQPKNVKMIVIAIAASALVLIPVGIMISHSENNSKAGNTTSNTANNTGRKDSGSGAQDSGTDSNGELAKGKQFFDKGKYIEAKEALTRAFSLATLNKDVPSKYEALVLLGQIDAAEGDADGARSKYYAVVSGYNRQDTDDRPNDRQAAAALNGLGIISTNQGLYERAHKHFKLALELRKKLPPKDADLSETLTGLGNLALYEQHYKQALDYFTTAKKTCDEVNGPDTADTANILNDMGQAFQFLGQYTEADSSYRQALDIRRSKLSATDPAIASSQMCMAALAFKKRDYVTSEKLFQDALAIDSKAFGTDNLVVSQIYFSLGILYQQQKKNEQAAEYYQKALEIQKQKLEPSSPKIAHTKALLEQVRGKRRR